MSKVDGLIIPRSYNDYFSRSDPTAIRELVSQYTDDALSSTSEVPVQNKVVKGALDDINDLIPAQASTSNQLADKSFVNSSIGTNTANYISDNGEPFASVAALEAYSGTVTNNDYAFVTGTDSAGNTYYDRYKATVSGSTVTWAKEYRLNNSSFTSVQWDAVNSGITAAAVARIPAGYVPEIDDTETSATKVWSSQKSVKNNLYVSSAQASDAKTVPSYFAADGASVKVLFINGHSGSTFTINGKGVYVNKNGAPVLMTYHEISSVNWFVQAYTTLGLVYLDSLNSNAGGWLVIGNPVVLSDTNYKIYADGYNEYDNYAVGVEVKTNKVWIDSNGKKWPIYRYVAYIASFTGINDPKTIFTLSDYSTKDLKSFEMTCNVGTLRYCGFYSRFEEGGSIVTKLYYNKSNGSFLCDSGLTITDTYIAIEYTKTTD